MTNKNDPVYPIGNDPIASEGISKREYFAAMAMQGFLSNPDIKFLCNQTNGPPRPFTRPVVPISCNMSCVNFPETRNSCLTDHAIIT